MGFLYQVQAIDSYRPNIAGGDFSPTDHADAQGLLVCVLATLKGQRMYGYDIVVPVGGGGLVMGEGRSPILSASSMKGWSRRRWPVARGPAEVFQLTGRGRIILTKM